MFILKPNIISEKDKKYYTFYRKVIDSLMVKSNRTPTIQEIASYVSLPPYRVVMELNKAQKVKIAKKVVYKNGEKIYIEELKNHLRPIDYKPKTEEREHLYHKYFLGLPVNERPTLIELSALIGKPKGFVARDLRYFECKYGYKFPIFESSTEQKLVQNSPILCLDFDSLLNTICSSEDFKRLNGYIEYIKEQGFIPTKSELSKQFDLSMTAICNDLDYLKIKKSIISEQDRETFYQRYYFDTSVPMSYLEMSKILDVPYDSIIRNILSLKDKYNSGCIDYSCEYYRRMKKDLDYNGRLSIRKSIYELMVKYNKHYSITHLCNLLDCHHNVVELDQKRITILKQIII